MIIREERPEDVEAVRRINDAAFGQPDEGRIVDALRENCRELISLVALDEKEVVGHILFSPTELRGEHGVLVGIGLAPMAVSPDHQRRGVGSALVEHGLRLLRDRLCPYVVVLGHPEYYPRFGFERASAHGVAPQWDGIPDEAFMLKVLGPPGLGGVRGTLHYRDEFSSTV